MAFEIDADLWGDEQTRLSDAEEASSGLIARDDEIRRGGRGAINEAENHSLPSGTRNILPCELSEECSTLMKAGEKTCLPANEGPGFVFDEHGIEATRAHDVSEATIGEGGNATTETRQADEFVAAGGRIAFVVKVGRRTSEYGVGFDDGGDADEIDMRGKRLELFAVFQSSVSMADEQQRRSHAG